MNQEQMVMELLTKYEEAHRIYDVETMWSLIDDTHYLGELAWSEEKNIRGGWEKLKEQNEISEKTFLLVSDLQPAHNHPMAPYLTACHTCKVKYHHKFSYAGQIYEMDKEQEFYIRFDNGKAYIHAKSAY